MTQTLARHMKLGIASLTVEGSFQGRTLAFCDFQAMVSLAEQIGFDSFWLADHLLLHLLEQEEKGCWEVFTLLSALAAVTKRITLGSLVACTSFRNPALLAKISD